MDDMFHICLMTKQNSYRFIGEFKSKLDGKRMGEFGGQNAIHSTLNTDCESGV